jgi:hypothetical protein
VVVAVALVQITVHLVVLVVVVVTLAQLAGLAHQVKGMQVALVLYLQEQALEEAVAQAP